MSQIIVEIKGDKKLDKYLKGLFGNMNFLLGRVGWMIAQKNATHIRITANRFRKKTPGGLADSIVAKKIGDKVYGVLADKKWKYVETGRPPGRRPPAQMGGPIQRWANGTLAGYMLSRYIGKHGTRPTWFVRNGIVSARPDWHQSLRSHLDYYVKTGGKIL